MLAAVGGHSQEPARAAREGSVAVLTRAAKACRCLVAIDLGRDFVP